MGILIEHFAGAFPLWLAPEQARVIPLSEKFNDYGRRVEAQMRAAGLRVGGDYLADTMKAKIRTASLEKVPYLLIVGEKEQADGTVAVRDESIPVADEKEVPLAFPGNEVPDPLPGAANKRAGYPVTVTFPRSHLVTKASGTLTTAAANILEVWFSSPDRPANPKYAGHQNNTLCLIAKEVLQPNTAYTVRFAAEVDGRPWAQTWTFTTGAGK